MIEKEDKGFISFTLLIVIVLITLSVSLLLLHGLWGSSEGVVDLLIQSLFEL